MGRFPEAIAELSDVLKTDDLAEYESALGRVYADAGNTEEAKAVLAHLLERRREPFVSASFVATVQIGLGDFEAAFASLEQAAREHSY